MIYLPGTNIKYTGNMVFFGAIAPLADSGGGLTLSQICSITGLDSATVQNWVRRGYVPHPVSKKYSSRHIARILSINSLRYALPLDTIGMMLKYLNGDTDDESDDIVTEEKLYDMFSLCALRAESQDVEKTAKSVVRDEHISDSADKLVICLAAMTNAYFASEYIKSSYEYLKKTNI